MSDVCYYCRENETCDRLVRLSIDVPVAVDGEIVFRFVAFVRFMMMMVVMVLSIGALLLTIVVGFVRRGVE